MTEKEKDLFKDLCTRLPYNPLVKYKGENYNVLGIAHGRLVLCKPLMSHTLNENPRVEDIKPCLRPMSSMTEEELKEYDIQCYIYDDIICHIDWLNAHHFDYRGLIEKGLAIDATNLNIY